MARAAGVTLQRSSWARGACIDGDRDRFAQVFINLISNAIKYNTNPRPAVSVSGTLRDTLYEARVADNGPGIPESDPERIFVKFTRGPRPPQIGVGLGLAISRQIVERFGGELCLSLPAMRRERNSW